MHFVLAALGLILIGILVYALRWVIIGLLGLLVCVIAIAYATQSCSGPHAPLDNAGDPIVGQVEKAYIPPAEFKPVTEPEVRRATLVNP